MIDDIRTVVIESHAELPTIISSLGDAVEARRRRRSVFFSGSVRENDRGAQAVRALASLLSKRMIGRGLTVITGLGRGIGSYITTAALDAIYHEPSGPTRAHQLVARPFPIGFESDPAARANHRKRMIADAGFAVFISGRDEDPSGVEEEYCIARSLGCYTIPIGSTGNESRRLWDETKARLDSVFGNRRHLVEEHFHRLNQPEASAAEIVDAVEEIITILQRE